MVAIQLQFLAGRYHATGWDHHANEGVPEWPPAPFRLLRALVSAFYRLPQPVDRELLARLVQRIAAPPTFQLPPASAAHTRHYMPLGALVDGRPKTTRVLDAFVAVGSGAVRPDPVIVDWPGIALAPEEEELLDALLVRVGYLGRAESWVRVERTPARNGGLTARPLMDGERENHEVRLLGLEEPSVYEAWRSSWRSPAASGGRRGRKAPVAPPADLLDVLHADTGELQTSGWSHVPGTRWIRYGFDEDPLRVRPRPRRIVSTARPTIARLVLQSRVMPRTVDTVLVAERIRTALLARTRDEVGESHPVFLGRERDGSPARGHRHAFLLPIDVDGDGHLDEVLVHAPEGFDGRALRALEGLERVWGSSGHDLHLRLATTGTPSSLCETAAGRGFAEHLAEARVWESRTPFVPPRHPKRRGGRWLDLPDDQVRRELGLRGLPEPVEVDALEQCPHPRGTAWYRFRRQRKDGGGSRASSGAFGFRLRFDQPVRGPLALGYGAHFGLGQFAAERSQSS